MINAYFQGWDMDAFKICFAAAFFSAIGLDWGPSCLAQTLKAGTSPQPEFVIRQDALTNQGDQVAPTLQDPGMDQGSSPDASEWADETLPDWLENIGLEEQESDGDQFSPQDSPAQSQPAAMVNPFGSLGDPLRMRPTLTGDWFGLRTDLMQRGIIYRGRVTHFLFGVAGGNTEPIPAGLRQIGLKAGDRFEHTSTSRHDLFVDLDKFCGPTGGKFIFTAENIMGTYGNVSLSTGSLASVFGAFSPADFDAEGALRVTNFFYLQPLSENLILGVGKLRLPGTADQDVFAGGDGTDQFINQTFAVNPMFIALFPISTFAVSAVMPQEWGHVSFAVIDPQERSTDFFEIGDVFSKGAIFQSQIKFNTDNFGQPGDFHLGAIFKNVDLLDLSATPAPPTYPYPPAPPGIAKKDESWALYSGFDQYLSVLGKDALGNRTGWGLFGRSGIADGGTGNPNFYSWHVSLGIGGHSPICCRHEKGDRFGIGYSFAATSNDWGPAAVSLFSPRDYQAVEAFYKFQVTPAISVTPDIQWNQGIFGGLSDFEDALIFGMRMNVKL